MRTPLIGSATQSLDCNLILTFLAVVPFVKEKPVPQDRC